jgi:hypothetical protein
MGIEEAANCIHIFSRGRVCSCYLNCLSIYKLIYFLLFVTLQYFNLLQLCSVLLHTFEYTILFSLHFSVLHNLSIITLVKSLPSQDRSLATFPSISMQELLYSKWAMQPLFSSIFKNTSALYLWLSTNMTILNNWAACLKKF